MYDRYNLPSDNFYRASPASKVDVMLDTPIESTGATIREIGASANPFEHQTKALLARIKEGASRVEFGFMGAGKGNKQSFTPESFGSAERREMKQLAMLNEVETSTHATPNTGPLSGLGKDGFNEQQREIVLKEIKKAVDFAAEATTGGAIVFHIGEWERPMETKYSEFRQYASDQYVDINGKKYSYEEYKKFSDDYIKNNKIHQITEKDKAQFILADKETGQIQAISRDMKFYMPEIDYDATKKIRESSGDKNIEVFVMNKDGNDKNQIKIKEYSFNDALEEVKKRADFDPELNKIIRNSDGKYRSDEEIVLRAHLDKEISQSKGEALRWTSRVPEALEQYKHLDSEVSNIKKEYTSSINNIRNSEDGRNLSEKEIEQRAMNSLGEKSRFLDDEFVQRQKESLMTEIRSGQSTGSSYMQRAAQMEKQIQNMKPIEEVGLSKTADTIAKAAIYAMEQSRRQKDLKNPLYVAPESYLPQQFGGHPDEIKQIIDASRKHFVEELTKSGRENKEDAEKLAKQHIKATLDIGHLNQWKQYLIKKDNETPDDYDKRFKTWILDKTEDLAKKGYVGHAHISDNFGYDDEHLIAGEGNAPISEFVKRMRKHGVNEFIQEPGSFNYEYALRQTWRNLGVNNLSAAYRGGGNLPARVDQFMNSYFGHTSRPSYVFGKYTSSIPNADKSWAPWSGTPL